MFSDEYNPYCSKWGYCTWTPSFGDTGPPQSKGAVEDGVRGQCRDDKDCTPWAPSCSPLGYCRGGVQVVNMIFLVVYSAFFPFRMEALDLELTLRKEETHLTGSKQMQRVAEAVMRNIMER